MKYYSVLLLIGIASCSSPTAKAPIIDLSSSAHLKLTFLNHDTATRVVYFMPCFCNLTDSGVVISHINRGGFVGESLITVFNHDSARFALRAWSDVESSPKFIFDRQSFTLNESSLKLGEIITGKINLSGYHDEFDSAILESGKMRFQIDGDFKCELKDTSYTWESYQTDIRRELFRQEMEKLERIAIENPDSVIELNLNSPDLKSIPEIVVRFTRLKRLRLGSEITALDIRLLSKLSQLEEINFASNEIHEIPADLSKLHNLKSIDLSGNPIARIPDTFYEQNLLTYLNLGATDLTSLSREVKRLRNLEHLHIGQTNIVNVPQEVFELERLTDLTLPDSIVPFSITNLNLKSLRTLHVPFTFLWYNKEDIHKLKNLDWLYPSFNYETQEDYLKNFSKEMRWLEKELPGVSISSFVSGY